MLVICVVLEETNEAIMEEWGATERAGAREWAEILRTALGHTRSSGCKCGQANFHPWIYFLFSKTKVLD